MRIWNKYFVMAGQSRLLLVGVGATIVATGALLLWLKLRKKLPSEWQKVGEISDIMCFPIKSCAPIRANEMNCDKLGLSKSGFLRDRCFLITDLDGNFITARDYPKMVLIQPEFDDQILILKAPGMIDAKITLEKIHKQAIKDAQVWGDKVSAIDCGEEAAKWLSRYIISDDVGLRLVYYPKRKSRTIRAKLADYPKVLSSDIGAFTDATSYMLLTESSVADLSNRIDKVLPVQQFRPNFVVRGSMPYEEDDWDYIKIGTDTVFQNIKPCTRCIFTTIDPETGVKDSDSEPLKTLRTYRQLSDPELRKKERYSPRLGIHLGLRTSGVVKIGDPVFVNIIKKSQ